MAPSETSDNTYFYCLPNSQAYDQSAYGWVQPISIEDEDLQFGGKSLSAWYEEERRRLSGSEDGEERRGRERVRKHHSKSSKSHKK